MSDMTLVWHIGRCTLFGMLIDAHGWHGWHIGGCTLFSMLVDAHGWHIGRCTCWHMVDTFH
jgi:hypothetical protein